MIYETNFKKLVRLGVIKVEEGKPLKVRRVGYKSVSAGFMPLCYDRLNHLDGFIGEGTIAFSLAHYFEQNGDLCCDPDMVIVLHPLMRMVEAISFQQAMPPVYQEVYSSDGKGVRPKLKKELNAFLGQWLTNLLNQGHGKDWQATL